MSDRSILRDLPTLQVFDLDEPKIYFNEGTSHFDNSKHGSYYSKSFVVEGKHESPDSIDLISNNKKLIGFLPLPFFHYFADFVSLILTVNSQEPNCEIIIDETVMLEDMSNNINFKMPNFYSFVYQMMDDLGINYRILRDTGKSVVNINNFALMNGYGHQHYAHASKKVLRYIENYIIKDHSEPFRKVYLSRKSIDNRIKSRIQDENIVEDFFESHGFEIVSVDSFSTIEEQIRFFYQAKVVCGLTGSGLTNILFTRDDQMVIELVTILGTPSHLNDNATLWHFHNFYKMIAFGKNQTLINVPNYSQNAESLVELISKHLEVLGEL